MARIATLENRIVSLRTAGEPGFDAVLDAELGTETATGGAGADAGTGTHASAAGDARTMASYLSVLSGQATGNASTTTLGNWVGTTAVGGSAGWGGSSAWGPTGTTGAAAATGTTSWPAVGGITPAIPRAPGQYDTLQPPAELAAFGNGSIPAEALAPIGIGSHRLYAPAAAAFQQMSADAAAQGVTIGVTDSYRSYDQQVDLARRKGLYSQGGLAATPGRSNHGWGLALDLDVDAGGQAWMRENGWRYGFVESVPREPWHWEYRPAGDGS